MFATSFVHFAWTTFSFSLASKAHALLNGDARHLDALYPGVPSRGIDCRVSIREMFSDSHQRDSSPVCIPISKAGKDKDEIYDIDLPHSLMKDHEDEIASGRLLVHLEDASIRYGKLVVPDNGSINVLQTSNRIRQLDAVTGVRTVLVVRVSTTDSQVTLSADELRNNIFSNTNVSFPTQMHSCSFGKLQFVPFQNVESGVVDVLVNSSVSEFATYSLLANATVNLLQTQFGVSQLDDIGVDHVMICLPPGGWAWSAESVLNHWRSLYNDAFCASLSYGMKQIGANLGLRNSGNNQSLEDDYTCYMGRPVPALDRPQKCYNGDKNFILGWYSDRTISFNPLTDGPRLVRFAAFVDYNLTASDDVVVAQVGTKLYLQYNRAKSFNSEVADLRDQVTIVQHESFQSVLLGGVNATSFDVNDFESSGRTLTIAACRTIEGSSTAPDVIIVSIGMDSANLCNQTTEPQTSPPVSSPSPSAGNGFTLPTAPTPSLVESLGPMAGSTFPPATTSAPSTLNNAPPTVSPETSSDPPSTVPSLLQSLSDSPSFVPSLEPSQLSTAAIDVTIHPTFSPSNTNNPTITPLPSVVAEAESSTEFPTITFPSNYTAPPNVTFHPTFSPTVTKFPTWGPTTTAYPTEQGPPPSEPTTTNRSNTTTASTPTPSSGATGFSDAPSYVPSLVSSSAASDSSDSPSFAPSSAPISGASSNPLPLKSEEPSISPNPQSSNDSPTPQPRRKRKRDKWSKKKSHKHHKGFFSENPFDPTVKNFKANKKRDQVLAKVFLRKTKGGKKKKI